ncbi:hypothetical protein PtoMrB4_32730 [Metapseudomonas otitidis]|uniref:Uncharacterized protein n=1 Tax=Metapseudomonas otitidis TaxID=319939 RepID=A0A679GE90_9GAMM|nr:hypothetical protein PtoMrB4_32730 [Pseudomonas otitidis]
MASVAFAWPQEQGLPGASARVERKCGDMPGTFQGLGVRVTLPVRVLPCGPVTLRLRVPLSRSRL